MPRLAVVPPIVRMVLPILVTRGTQVVELAEAVLLRDPLARVARAVDPNVDLFVVGVHARLGVGGRDGLRVTNVSMGTVGRGYGRRGTYELGVLAELAQGVDDIRVLLGAGHIVFDGGDGLGEEEEAGQHGGEEGDEGLHGCDCRYLVVAEEVRQRCGKETWAELRDGDGHIRRFLVTSYLDS